MIYNNTSYEYHRNCDIIEIVKMHFINIQILRNVLKTKYPYYEGKGINLLANDENLLKGNIKGR